MKPSQKCGGFLLPTDSDDPSSGENRLATKFKKSIKKIWL